MGNCFGPKTNSAGGGSGGITSKQQYVDSKESRTGEAMSRQGVKDLKKIYHIKEKPLGKGSFGKVYLAYDRQDTSFKVAIKVLNKAKMSSADLRSIMDEVKVLNKVDHPNITKYFETYEDKPFLYLVMEYCPGGELFDSQESFVKNSKGYTERDAAKIVIKCLEALQHCHALGITHRDMKPENIMYGKDHEVRLVDFGLSKECKSAMNTYAGTPYFMAPELVDNKEYGHKIDVWSLGCVLYMLVAGRLPFEGYTKQEVFGKIRKGSYRVPNCSDDCKDLIAKMLTVDEASRPTAGECWDHHWFKAEHIVNENVEALPIPMDVLNNLRNFQGTSALRRAALMILVKMLNPLEFQRLREEFNKIDTNHSGTIEADELRHAVKTSNMQLSEEEVEHIVRQCDQDENGLINYHEFIAATFPVKKYLTKERIASLFSRFNTDDDDKISPMNFKDAFSKLGIEISQAEIETILKEHDLDGDCEITIAEFEQMLKADL